LFVGGNKQRHPPHILVVNHLEEGLLGLGDPLTVARVHHVDHSVAFLQYLDQELDIVTSLQYLRSRMAFLQ
jgi:hypothetical protein